MIASTENSTKILRIMVLALGAVLTIMATSSLAAKPAHASTTFTVINTNDSGPGSLRQAITNANVTTGADAIEFDIDGTGVNTIAPTSQLPTITGPVTINGYSQPGSQPNTRTVGSDAVLKVVLSGTGAPGADGLVIGASNSTVRGLVINRWSYGIYNVGTDSANNRIAGNFIGTDASGTQSVGNGCGVRFQYGSNNTLGGTTPAARNVISGNLSYGVCLGDGDTTDNRVVGNYIGTDASGTKDLGNGRFGVNVDSVPGNTIGGTTAAERNVISGNDRDGIAIYARGTRVTGNYIGTDATGTRDLGNSFDGVSINGGENNTVGGTAAAERNVISGNDQHGVAIKDPRTRANKVSGNYIGTDKTGAIDVGNSGAGVSIVGAPNNAVGGTTAGERNVISANDVQGVVVSGTAATGNRVVGNYIGTDASGTEDLGNYEQGVLINEAPANTVGGTTPAERNVVSANDAEGVLVVGFGAKGNKVTGNFVGTDETGTSPLGNVNDGVLLLNTSDNTVGGTTAGTGNVIAHSTSGNGVKVYGSVAAGNRVLSNSIFANAKLGIELGGEGPTANDPDDADTGPNYLQNKPVISSAKKNSAGTTTIRGKLNSTPNATFRVQFFSNPKGTDEGKTLLGSKIVSTDEFGDATFVFSTKKQIRLGQNVTATATGAGGTSEFSAPKKLVAS